MDQQEVTRTVNLGPYRVQPLRNRRPSEIPPAIRLAIANKQLVKAVKWSLTGVELLSKGLADSDDPSRDALDIASAVNEASMAFMKFSLGAYPSRLPALILGSQLFVIVMANENSAALRTLATVLQIAVIGMTNIEKAWRDGVQLLSRLDAAAASAIASTGLYSSQHVSALFDEVSNHQTLTEATRERFKSLKKSGEELAEEIDGLEQQVAELQVRRDTLHVRIAELEADAEEPEAAVDSAREGRQSEGE